MASTASNQSRLLAACRSTVSLCVANALLGCAGLPPVPRGSLPGPKRPEPLGLALDGPIDPNVRVGDALALSVLGEGERQETPVVVDGLGQVHVGPQRDVKVADMPLTEAERRVRDALRERDKFAEVELRPSGAESRHVSVLGAVARPGSFPQAPGMRVIDAIAAAGGLLTRATGDGVSVAIADLDRGVLLRRGTVTPVSLRAAAEARAGHNVYLHGGDFLYVPFANDQRVSVFGQVNGPDVFVHRPGLRLTEALSHAGGLTPDGDKSDIRVLRGPVAAPNVYRASLAAIADGDAPDVELAPGDAVFVEDDPAEDLREFLDALLPLSTVAFSAVVLLLVVE